MPSSTSNSENAYPAPKTAYFDPEHVERPVPVRPWRAMTLAAVVVTIALLAGWELYWRAHWHTPGDFKNTAGLWAQERAKAKDDATVIVGSSRIFFDIDLDIWEEISGIRPVQLALEGTSPKMFFDDLVADEEFHGTIIVGVTAPLFFSGYAYRGDVLEYSKHQSPSEWLGHRLSYFMERNFAFFDEATRPKTMLFYAQMPLREGMIQRVDVHKLERMDATRNGEIWLRVMEDDAYRQLAKDVWAYTSAQMAPAPSEDGSPPPPFPQERIDALISDMKAGVETLRARGGEVVFLRLPYEGGYEVVEDMGFPRERFWDPLIFETDTVGISFHDYEALQGHYIAEWSHLGPQAAKDYTRALLPIFYDTLAARENERAAALK